MSTPQSPPQPSAVSLPPVPPPVAPQQVQDVILIPRWLGAILQTVLAAVILAIAGFVWSLHQRQSALETEHALLRQELGHIKEGISRIEATITKQ